jgi:hypothetical protein
MTARDLEEFVEEREGGLLFERSQFLNSKIFKKGNFLTVCIQSMTWLRLFPLKSRYSREKRLERKSRLVKLT